MSLHAETGYNYLFMGVVTVSLSWLQLGTQIATFIGSVCGAVLGLYGMYKLIKEKINAG